MLDCSLNKIEVAYIYIFIIVNSIVNSLILVIKHGHFRRSLSSSFVILIRETVPCKNIVIINNK